MEDTKEKLLEYRRRRAAQQPQQTRGDSSSDPAQTSRHTVATSEIPTQDETEHTHWVQKLLKVVLWLLLWGLCIELEFGVVFLLSSFLYFIWASLRGSRRRPGEPSAYSVFNKDCEAIDGTLSGEQLDRELRYGPLSVKKTSSE